MTNARVVTGSVFKIECAVDSVVQQYIVVEADTDEQAIGCALLHYGKLDGNDGKKVVPISIAPINFAKV